MHSDSVLCLSYAQLIRRPRSNYMETLQQDITTSMRGVLIDWLVEVCMDCYWESLCLHFYDFRPILGH